MRSDLLVVNDEEVVEKRNVELGALVNGLRVIERGIEPGDRIVVTGVQRAREGIAVQAQEIDMASLQISSNPATGTADPDHAGTGAGQTAEGGQSASPPAAATD